MLQPVLPFTMAMNVWHRSLELISYKQMPSTCELESNWVSTFDNKTYKYEMNGCQHLLFKDCSNKDQTAVLGQGQQGQMEKVEAILHNSIVKMTSQSFQGQSAKVEVDGQQMEIRQGKPYYKYAEKHGIKLEVLHIELTADNVLIVSNRNVRTAVYYDGKRVQILAPPHVFARSCGLCGDLNGENTADVLSPKACLLSQPRYNAYTYMMKQSSGSSGSKCQGIPSEDKEQFQREEQRCVKKREIITPLQQLTENYKHQTQTQTLKHVVIKQLNRICISKRLIKVCKDADDKKFGSNQGQQGQGQQGQQGEKLELPFTCMIKDDARVENILKRVEGGEKVTEVILSPTHFTTSHYVPIGCGSEAVTQYHQQVNRPRILNHRLEQRNY